MNGAPTKLLFVCMGNICRSPTAEGMFRKLIVERSLERQFEIDSAGTHAYHVGEPPDPRAVEAAARRGVDLTAIRARRVVKDDFERFDLLLAMDEDNHSLLVGNAPHARDKVRLFLEYAPDAATRSVPDPYYGGANGFEQVLDLVEAAAEGLLDELLRNR